jgi:NAD(P)-dependent dehydrogenase (short-subunit alcohol dehydrogenase family)
VTGRLAGKVAPVTGTTGGQGRVAALLFVVDGAWSAVLPGAL